MKAVDQAYCDGLLDGQRLAAAFSNRLMSQGETLAANEMARLASELLLIREKYEAREVTRMGL